jgi:hypothetical protein
MGTFCNQNLEINRQELFDRRKYSGRMKWTDEQEWWK